MRVVITSIHKNDAFYSDDYIFKGITGELPDGVEVKEHKRGWKSFIFMPDDGLGSVYFYKAKYEPLST